MSNPEGAEKFSQSTDVLHTESVKDLMRREREFNEKAPFRKFLGFKLFFKELSYDESEKQFLLQNIFETGEHMVKVDEDPMTYAFSSLGFSQLNKEAITPEALENAKKVYFTEKQQYLIKIIARAVSKFEGYAKSDGINVNRGIYFLKKIEQATWDKKWEDVSEYTGSFRQYVTTLYELSTNFVGEDAESDSVEDDLRRL
jgi:hypothetical protein